MIKNFFILAICFLLWAPGHAQVEDSEKTVLYVTDQLRLSLYLEADAQSDVLLYLSSGDRLVVEEVSGAYAKVTAPSGRQGWVKRGFLVTEPTATIKLEEMIETNEVLKEELLGRSEVSGEDELGQLVKLASVIASVLER